jgi:hypothetical protein
MTAGKGNLWRTSAHPVVRRVNQVLFVPEITQTCCGTFALFEVTLGCLEDACPDKQLDLLQRASGGSAQLCAAAQVGGNDAGTPAAAAYCWRSCQNTFFAYTCNLNLVAPAHTA